MEARLVMKSWEKRGVKEKREESKKKVRSKKVGRNKPKNKLLRKRQIA